MLEWPMEEYVVRAALEGLLIIPTVVFSVYAFFRIRHTEVHARRAHILYRCALVLSVLEYLLDAIWYAICAVMIGLPDMTMEAMRSFQSVISRASLVEDLISHISATIILLCEAQIVAAIYISTKEKRNRYFTLGIYIISISVMVLSLHFFGWMEWYYTRFLTSDDSDPTLNDKDGRIFDAFNDVDAFAWALNLLGAVVVLGFALLLKYRIRKQGLKDLNPPTTYLVAASAVHIVVRSWDVYVKAEGIELLHFSNGNLDDFSSWDSHGLVMVDCFLHGWLSFVNLILLFVLLLKKGGSWSEKKEQVIVEQKVRIDEPGVSFVIPARVRRLDDIEIRTI